MFKRRLGSRVTTSDSITNTLQLGLKLSMSLGRSKGSESFQIAIAIGESDSGYDSNSLPDSTVMNYETHGAFERGLMESRMVTTKQLLVAADLFERLLRIAPKARGKRQKEHHKEIRKYLNALRRKSIGSPK